MNKTEAVRDGERWWWGQQPPGDHPPQVIDSWLVQEGRSRRPERHIQRFAATAELLVHFQDLHVVVDEVLARIPRAGRWFPRLEAYNDAVALWLRPAGDAPTEIALWVADVPDPRKWPHIKGPDLVVQGQLQGRARELGAEDALLWRIEERLPEAMEATYSALVWWDGEAFVTRPDDDLSLPSVTIECLEISLADTPHPLRRGRVTVDALLDKPVWAVNAARGIQQVSSWVMPDGEPRHSPHGALTAGLTSMLCDALEETTGPLPEQLTT